jgi:hypothetical protein
MMPAFSQASTNSGLSDRKAVTWMDRVHARFLSDAKHFFDRQVGIDGPERFLQMRAAPDQIGLVRLETVQRQLVFFGVDGDGLEPQFIGSAEDADRDFRAVGDENSLAGSAQRRGASAVGLARRSPGRERPGSGDSS